MIWFAFENVNFCIFQERIQISDMWVLFLKITSSRYMSYYKIQLKYTALMGNQTLLGKFSVISIFILNLLLILITLLGHLVFGLLLCHIIISSHDLRKFD